MSTVAVPLAASTSGRSDLPRWAASFGVILALHAAIVAALMFHRTVVNEPGDEALPAIMIDMAPSPAAPKAAPNQLPTTEEVPEAAVPDAVLDAPPDTPDPDVPPPEPQPTVMAEVPPPESLPDAPSLDRTLKPPPVVEKAEVTRPPPAPKPKPQPPKPREKVVERKPPKPVQAKRAERQDARRPPAERAGTQATASLPSTSSGSSAASRSSWQGAIVAALNRAKRPQPSTGLASVRFSIDRGGRVLSASLVGSAGNPALDQEAVGLVRRAGLPSAPGDVPGSSFTFTVPIRFSAR